MADLDLDGLALVAVASCQLHWTSSPPANTRNHHCIPFGHLLCDRICNLDAWSVTLLNVSTKGTSRLWPVGLWRKGLTTITAVDADGS